MFNLPSSDKLEDIFASTSGKQLFAKVVSTIRNFSMLDNNIPGVLVAFSGGADSVALLLSILNYKRLYAPDMHVVACHINHMIRGDESDRDEEFSKAFCNAIGVELISEKLNVPVIAERFRLGIEEAARDVRYKVFEGLLRGRMDLSLISTAHNATDNCETILYNIGRGSSLRGAAGIPPVRDNIIRPLIELPKSDIVAFLEENGISYVYDSTNDSLEYTRNYIRHCILPSLSRINPLFEKAFSDFASSARSDADYLDQLAESVLESYEDSMPLASDLRSLEYPILSRVLYNLAKQNGARLERKHIVSIAKMLSESDNFTVSVIGAKFLVERGECSFMRNNTESLELSQKLYDGYNSLNGFAGAIIVNNIPDDSSRNVYKFEISVNISSDIIKGDLRVRFKQDGDAYRYGGITHKLKKVFNDLDIPPSIRSKIPVIIDDIGILWVPGLPPREGASSESLNATTKITFVVTDSGLEPIYPAKKYDIKKGRKILDESKF